MAARQASRRASSTLRPDAFESRCSRHRRSPPVIAALGVNRSAARSSRRGRRTPARPRAPAWTAPERPSTRAKTRHPVVELDCRHDVRAPRPRTRRSNGAVHHDPRVDLAAPGRARTSGGRRAAPRARRHRREAVPRARRALLEHESVRPRAPSQNAALSRSGDRSGSLRTRPSPCSATREPGWALLGERLRVPRARRRTSGSRSRCAPARSAARRRPAVVGPQRVQHLLGVRHGERALRRDRLRPARGPSSSSSSSATTRLARPHSTASSAPRNRPVKISSAARSRPIARGSSVSTPPPPICPKLRWPSPMRAERGDEREVAVEDQLEAAGGGHAVDEAR